MDIQEYLAKYPLRCHDKADNQVDLTANFVPFIQGLIRADMVICELGSNKGISSGLFAMHCKKVYCVDPWTELRFAPNEKLFDKMVLMFPNIVKMKMTGDEAVKQFADGVFDLVYIDALHTYSAVKSDIANWLPKVKRGGIISGHDYEVHQVGVCKAVNSAFEKVQTWPDSSWSVERR